MDMGTQGAGRKRLPNRERLTAEDDALNQIAREAEARLAAKRAARAEAREIRMKELERQQKEIYQVQKKYYGLDARWGDIEQWMEDSEHCSARSRRQSSACDMEERASLGSRGSWRSQLDTEHRGACAWGLSGSVLSLSSGGLASQAWPAQNGSWGTPWGDSNILDGPRRASVCAPLAPSEHGLNSGSRASSRASSARASPVVEERPEKEFAEKASRNLPSLSAATLASLGGGTSRRNSGDTCTSVDTEASVREMRELSELQEQIQDVEGKYMQGLKEMKDSLLEAEEKYKKAMVSNAQLDNEKTNFMYQVDTLKDMLLELEEQLAESQRQCEEKSKELEREKHAHSVLQFQFAEVKEALKQREEMLEALERQKEFFDSVRSERDDLREEVVKLKEGLKKHGIILNSETATNGETPCTLADAVHPSLASASREGLGALPAAGDGAPGSASEVPRTRGSVARVGHTEISPRTERDPPAEAPGEAGTATEAAHPRGDSGQSQRAPEECAPVPEALPECSGQNPPGAEQPGRGEPAVPRPSSPLKSSSDLVDPEGERAADATEEQCPGLAPAPEMSPDTQGPTQGAQVGGDSQEEEDEGRGPRGEKPSHARPAAPTAAPGTGEANSDPPEMKEADREMQGPPGEAADSSQKKAKNKKKKNKKKRAPATTNSGHDAEEDAASQTSDSGAVKGEEPVEGAKQKPEPQAPNTGPHTPPPEVAAGGGEEPEPSRTEWGREQEQEDGASSAPATPGSVEGVPGAGEGSAPQEEEEGPSEGSQGSPPGSPASPHSRAGGDTEPVSAEDGDSAAAGELENSEDARDSSGRGRGKEDCALS
ncbi:leucine-rich repeat flightless-interacting protein 1 isoform X3 [Sorex fumeus]|uniref:leucine-rich repeat flightless-interacting protein 1 isoform X3 n=1 Tax=Sorex fumeus TaxID=62283 RepID=UPI0024ACC5E2|nr:leucine-rich repeat flightless-interacting protein 1 isoform X3 [Sorex fumeus]